MIRARLIVHPQAGADRAVEFVPLITGTLQNLVVPRMPLVDFVAVLQRLSAGQPGGDAVMHFRAAAFDLEFDRTVRVNTDGEVLDAHRCEYRVRAGGARFFCGARPQSVGSTRPWRG